MNLPAGNQDIAPTILALEGLALPQTLDGRVLSEALRVPSKQPRKASSRRFQVSVGDFCSEIEASYAGRSRYLNHARRCRTTR